MIYRDGTYFLRTNQTGKEAVELWQQYMLQCNVEQAFRDIKSDLSITYRRGYLRSLADNFSEMATFKIFY